MVYKGRKKHTISYYAIKSVDKDQKPRRAARVRIHYALDYRTVAPAEARDAPALRRVLQEVKAMHVLDNQGVLKFFAWYETTNHLWLILEYCVGGSLLALLKQDMSLPETSIHDFARDLVSSLTYLHNRGFIYCDLKPSNVLLDENGRLKLGGFGLSRKLTEINRQAQAGQPLPTAKHGTPVYMAPELFMEGAIHSTRRADATQGLVLGSRCIIPRNSRPSLNLFDADAAPVSIPLPSDRTSGPWDACCTRWRAAGRPSWPRPWPSLSRTSSTRSPHHFRATPRLSRTSSPACSTRTPPLASRGTTLVSVAGTRGLPRTPHAPVHAPRTVAEAAW